MRALIRSLLLLCAIFLPATACYQHNGDIGSWFGSWKVTEITIDGLQDESYKQNMFFAFQSQVFGLTVVSQPHVATTYYAEWSETDNTLTIDFSHTANPEDQYAFTPPAASHLADGVNILHIDRISSRKLSLTMATADGQTITYHITKQ